MPESCPRAVHRRRCSSLGPGPIHKSPSTIDVDDAAGDADVVGRRVRRV